LTRHPVASHLTSTTERGHSEIVIIYCSE